MGSGPALGTSPSCAADRCRAGVHECKRAAVWSSSWPMCLGTYTCVHACSHVHVCERAPTVTTHVRSVDMCLTCASGPGHRRLWPGWQLSPNCPPTPGAAASWSPSPDRPSSFWAPNLASLELERRPDRALRLTRRGNRSPLCAATQPRAWAPPSRRSFLLGPRKALLPAHLPRPPGPESGWDREQSWEEG